MHKRDACANEGNLFREMDSIQKVPKANRYNKSVRLSIKNRFKK